MSYIEISDRQAACLAIIRWFSETWTGVVRVNANLPNWSYARQSLSNCIKHKYIECFNKNIGDMKLTDLGKEQLRRWEEVNGELR